MKRLAFLGFLLFSTSGCSSYFPHGHFEGSLVWEGIPGQEDESLAGIDFALQANKSDGKIRVNGINGELIIDMDISNIQAKSFNLLVPRVRPEPFFLIQSKFSPDKRRNLVGQNIICFADRGEWLAELCFNHLMFKLSIYGVGHRGILRLLGTSFHPIDDFLLEKPVRLTLAEAEEKAFEANLDSRIAFENLIQAKNTSTAAHLNLIPHLTTNLIWNAIPSYVTFIATLQGLVPFLLPSYWLQAKEADLDYKVKEYAELILQADLAALVEQLSYSFEGDKRILAIQSNVLENILKFQKELEEMEKRSEIPPGSAGSLSDDLVKIRDEQFKVMQLIQENQYNLSRALGYRNPEAVLAVSFDDKKVPPLAPKLSKEQLAIIASRRSFELQQINYLKQIANLRKTELYFTWMDPTGDPRSSFGFNLIGQFKVAESQIQEIALKAEQLQTAVYQNAYRIWDEYTSVVSVLNQMGLSERSVQDDPFALLKQLEEMVKKDGFDHTQVARLIQIYLSDKIGEVANLTAFRNSLAKMDRLFLKGYFEGLLPHLDTQDDLELSAELFSLGEDYSGQKEPSRLSEFETEPCFYGDF